MERPKVRFSKDYNEFKENEPEFFDLTKNDPKVKTVVPVKYNISYSKNDRKFILKSSIVDDSEKLAPENVQQNGFFENPAEKILNDLSNSSIRTDTQIDDSFLKHELRAEEEYRIEQEMLKSVENMQNLKLNTESPASEVLPEHEPVSLKTEELAKNIVNHEQQNLHAPTRKVVDFESQNLHKSSTPPIPCIDCYDTDEENDIEVMSVIKNSVVQENSKKSVLEDKLPSKTSSKPNGTTKTTKSTNNIEDIAKHLSVQNAKKTEALKKPLIRKSVSFAKPVPSVNLSARSQQGFLHRGVNKIQVAPCHKYKFSSQNKESNPSQRKPTTIKKTVVLNPEKKPENVAVIPSSSSDSHKLDVGEDSNKVISSENLLSRPEFNSSVHLMKKLKDLEKEKKIIDINQLSPNYKSLIHGKVSACLNFPPHELVFKDLVNLSIDDDILASRFMRTKDPEPRAKEIVPDLSHFYTPRQIEPKFHTYSQIYPRITNRGNWSTSKMFSKLNTWKASLDET